MEAERVGRHIVPDAAGEANPASNREGRETLRGADADVLVPGIGRPANLLEPAADAGFERLVLVARSNLCPSP